MLPTALFVDELSAHAPGILGSCRAVLKQTALRGVVLPLAESFTRCRADSIDYAVMEKTAAAAVAPLDAGWRDAGSWPALGEMLEKDAEGNVVRGNALTDRCTNSFVRPIRPGVMDITFSGVLGSCHDRHVTGVAEPSGCLLRH